MSEAAACGYASPMANHKRKRKANGGWAKGSLPGKATEGGASPESAKAKSRRTKAKAKARVKARTPVKSGMKITAGEHRGRFLVTPPGENFLRPMRVQVREALFNVLGDVEGAVVLDLFSGSGCLAIEALSRGAARAVLVERARPCLTAIGMNLEALGLTERADVRRHDLNLGVGALAGAGPYDLVMVHPPFDLLGKLMGKAEPKQTLDVAALLRSLVTTTGLLAEEGRVAFETPRGCYPDPEVSLAGLEVLRRKDYGTTTLFVAARAEVSAEEEAIAAASAAEAASGEDVPADAGADTSLGADSA